MSLWYCRCGNQFESPADIMAECPECGTAIYFSPSYGNFDGFMYEQEYEQQEKDKKQAWSCSGYRKLT